MDSIAKATQKPERTANWDARKLVQQLTPFIGSNMFAKWEGDRYVVYSYGRHFPMHIWHHDKWYENVDRYSRTTSKQQSQTNPLVANRMPLSTHYMIGLAERGYEWLVAQRLKGEELK